MLRIVAIVAVASLAALGAVFACFMALASGLAGDHASPFLWMGACMLAILYSAFVIASLDDHETDAGGDHSDETDTRAGDPR